MKCKIWICVKWVDLYGSLFVLPLYYIYLKKIVTCVFTGSDYSVLYRLLLVTCYRSGGVVDGTLSERMLHQSQSNTLLN